MRNLAKGSTEDSMTVINIDPFMQGHIGTVFIPLYWGRTGLHLCLPVASSWEHKPCASCPTATPTSGERARLGELLAEDQQWQFFQLQHPSSQPSSQAALQPGSQAGSAADPGSSKKLSPTFPGGLLWTRNQITSWLLWLLVLMWPPPCDAKKPLTPLGFSLLRAVVHHPSHVCDISMDQSFLIADTRILQGRSQNTGLIWKCSHQTAQFPFLFDCLVRFHDPQVPSSPCVNSIQNTRYFSN